MRCIKEGTDSAGANFAQITSATFFMTTEAIDRFLNRLYGQVRQTLVQLDHAVVSRDWSTCMEQVERHIEQESAGLARWGRLDPAQAGDIDSLLQRHLPAAQAAAREHFIDVSAMEPPGPFVSIMEELSRGHVPLRVRIHREPLPLYAALAERGFAYRTRRLDDGCFEIRIVRSADEPGIA